MKNKITTADIEAGVKNRAAKNMALTYLGLTSFVVTFPYGFSMVSKIVPEWIAWLPAALLSLLIYRFIDGSLADDLRYIEKTAGTGSANRRRKVARIASILLLIATASFTYVANFFVANTAIKPPDIEQLKEGEADNLSAYSDKSEYLSANLSEARRDLSEAKKEGHKLVESARKSSNPEWARRFGPHLAYAQTQLQRGKLSGAFRKWYLDVRQAQTDSAQLVEAARRNLSEAKAANLAHLSVTPDSLNSAIDKAFLSELNWSNSLRQKFTTFLIFTDGVAAVVIYFCHWWLCLFFRDGGRLPESKASWQYHSDKYLSSVADKWKQRILPADSLPEEPDQPAPDPQQIAPGLQPVRATNQFDSYELARRQQMGEARMAEMERKYEERIRQIEARREEEARQNVERIRKEKERADKLAAERARAARKKPTNDTLKPVSDKDSGKVSAKIVGNSVEFDGKTYNLSELSKFVDNAAKCYERQFSLSTEAGRAKNKARWDAARPALEKLGYRIEYKGHKVSITGGKVIKA